MSKEALTENEQVECRGCGLFQPRREIPSCRRCGCKVQPARLAPVYEQFPVSGGNIIPFQRPNPWRVS